LVFQKETAIIGHVKLKENKAIHASNGLHYCCGIVDGYVYPSDFRPRINVEDYLARMVLMLYIH